MRILVLLLSFFSTSLLANELVVFTSRNEHLIKDIFQQYEKKTGVKINYRTGEPGALIQALKAGGENSSADILLTVDAGNLWFAKNEGLFRALDSEILNKTIPTHLKDPDNHWFGLSLRARTFVYNPNKIQTSELSTYEDLANPKWKGRLCLRTSKKVYNQSLVAMLIDQHGEEKTQQIVKGWVENAVDIFANDNAVMKAISAGQCDIGIVNTYYYGRLMQEDSKLPLKLFWPNQDSTGVHINVSGAGVLKQSKRPEEAQKFLEWLASSEAQNSFAAINMEYPVLSGTAWDPLVESWGKFKQNTSFQLSKAGVLQQDAIKLMHHVQYR